MTPSELFALLPLVALASGIVVTMLVAAFARASGDCHGTVMRLSAITLFITLTSLFYAAKEAPIAVTPLLMIDGYSLLVMGLILATSLVICLLAHPYWHARALHREEFYLLLLLGTLGAVVLAAAQHFAALLLGLETLGIALFAMSAYSTRLSGLSPQDRTASSAIDSGLEASLKYLVLSGVASALMLFGIALLYLETGHLDFAGINSAGINRADSEASALIFYAGLALVLSGVGFKLSLVPFHLWTPDVYQGAPAPVTAFIATVSKGAIFAVILRFFVASNSLDDATTVQAIAAIAALSMIVGNWLALMQDNLKRLLAYSSIAHLGYLFIAFLTLQSIDAGLAVEASAVYLSAYLATSLLAFGIVTLLSSGEGPASRGEEVCELTDYRGLFWRHPFIACALTVALLSLAGIPLTFGFIGKFYLFSVGAQAELWWLIGALIIGSGIGLFYYLRVITTLFNSTEVGANSEHWQAAPIYASSCAFIAVLTAGLIVYGVYPQPVIESIQALAVTLVEPANNLARF